MNTELFIAKRIIKSKDNGNKISKPVVRTAIVGVALSFIVMILSLSITTGFKKEIRNKIVGFGSHIQITNYDANYSHETVPVFRNQEFLPEIENTKGVKHIQVFATKPGIIKTKTDIQGIVLKGVDKDFDWSFFNKHLTDGEIFSVKDSASINDILISKKLATLLKFEVGDKLFMYFVQDPPRMRKFIVSGIYQTGVEEFDKLFAIVDIKHIQKLNDWNKDQISGFEIYIDNFEDLNATGQEIANIAGGMFLDDGSRLRVQSIKQRFPHLFDWTELFNTNIIIILVLMTLVAGFNMISGLLILILERTRMIGILKAMGTENWSIRKIFLYNAMYLTGKGMLWGNAIGISLCLIQQYFGIIKLDAEAYYLSVVPIDISIMQILLLNLGTVAVTGLILLLPSIIITKISPAKAIRFN